MGRIVWFVDCSSFRFVRTGWVLSYRRSGAVRRSIGPGQRVVGYIEGDVVGPLYYGRWYWRRIAIVRDGDAALSYLPDQAIVVSERRAA